MVDRIAERVGLRHRFTTHTLRHLCLTHLARVGWSLQAGLVLIAMGIGFDLVSLRVKGEASEALYGLGMLGLLIGIALAVSAGVFYVLSRKFGLWQPPAPQATAAMSQVRLRRARRVAHPQPITAAPARRDRPARRLPSPASAGD